MPPNSSVGVRREYARLAPSYDRRWERYLRESTGFTLEAVQLRPGLELLDVGCGTGWLLSEAANREPRIRVTGVDISREMLRVARLRLCARGRLVEADAERLPFPAGSFDIVLSSSGLHYCPEPARAIREMARVLRPGGTVVVTDWSADRLRVRVLGWLLRGVGRPVGRILRSRELAEIFEPNGFTELRVQHRTIAAWWPLQRVVGTRQPR